jgi:predicted phosphohydrolase
MKVKNIFDIMVIKKYTAQRQWRKLCILFKLYPELLFFHNNGYYLKNYIVYGENIIWIKNGLDSRHFIFRYNNCDTLITVKETSLINDNSFLLKAKAEYYDIKLCIIRDVYFL